MDAAFGRTYGDEEEEFMLLDTDFDEDYQYSLNLCPSSKMDYDGYDD